MTDQVATRQLDWNELDINAELPDLESDDIHLWVLDLAMFDSTILASWIQSAEYTRAERIQDTAKRELYLGGRLGLRYLLNRYTGIANSALRFGYGSRGKPMLLNKTGKSMPTFNYTLSQDKVLYAIAPSRPLGIDLEVLPRTVAAEQMAKRHLTHIERLAWQNLPSRESNDAMLSCWTRKEAYGKALGVGIRYQLNAVTVFHHLQTNTWQVERAGLLESSGSGEMPEQLEGVQLCLPFQGVASLMYGINLDDIAGAKLSAGQLKI